MTLKEESRHRKYINKSLEKYGITIEEIDKQSGEKKLGTKKAEPYYIKYTFSNAEEYEKWRAFVKKDLAKEMPELDEEEIEQEFDWIEASIGLSRPYLFQKQQSLL